MDEERTLSTIKKILLEKNVSDPFKVAREILFLYNIAAKGMSYNEDILISCVEKVLSKNDNMEDYKENEEINYYRKAANIKLEPNIVKLRRKSVSGKRANINENDIQFYDKDSQTFAMLYNILEKSLLFQFLNPKQRRKFVWCMAPLTVENNVNLINQDDEGDKMYFVEDGEFDIYKDGEVVGKVCNGAVFGEVALLYNVPRTATVRSVRISKVWFITQGCYMALKIVDEMKKRDFLEKRLGEMKELKFKDKKTFLKVVNGSKRVFFREGTRIEIKKDYFLLVTDDGVINDKKGVAKVCVGDFIELDGLVAVSEIEGFLVPSSFT
ncbi:cyclic nucleotide-binding domain-containing protein [Hamiltosporidium magnivora]|uniref:Cyclic nucleotide-binding domain-containing protein n=1 Tax=Hamiltosporidium magnivora TaxID=148818 RepID=A0A4Q9LD66_9MICR|nr:cyclic nucleotide-binding domain-containing protein [Hamiltosporidium magnivora]